MQRLVGVHLICVTQSTERLPFRLDQFSGADHSTTVPASESVVVPNLSIGLIGSDGVSCCNYNSAMDGFATGRVGGMALSNVFCLLLDWSPSPTQFAF